MADKLYRSHSLEFSDEGTSGSLTIWEDSPVSPFNVGDTFRPVPQSPALTVDKVSIKDNVIGEANGKTLRQWEITIEGSNFQDEQQQDTQTHIKYNFNISENEKSGTMEVINTGDNPAVSIDIGDTFSVPGIGEVTCVKVSGNDSYDDNDVHSWTVTYEGSDNPEQIQDDDALPETKYSLSIEKDNDGDIQKSGSMSVVNTGNAPVFNVSVGDNFSVPGIGQIKCTKVSASDDYSNSGNHRWTVNYEGIIAGSSDDNPYEPDINAKYSFSIDNDSLSGSVEFTAAGNEPVFAHNVGDTITLPGIGEVTCTKISGSDSYSDNGKRKWTVVYEASNENQSQQQQESNIKYSLSIENNSDGVTIYSGSKEFTCTDEVPAIDINIGDKFSLPLVGELTCTKIHSSNNDDDSWTVTIEGSRGGTETGSDDEQGLPENETAINYEINGSTVRSVAGEFIALRRSETPVTKKSITVYTSTVDAVAVPGSTYEGGIVTSENISKETIKNNGVVTASYYKHSIEVES